MVANILAWFVNNFQKLQALSSPILSRLFRLLRKRRLPPKTVKGLYPYYESDGPLFEALGREAEIQQCVELLRAQEYPLIALYGLSGCGKTSLLRAGIRYTVNKDDSGINCRCFYWPALKFVVPEPVAPEAERVVILIDQFELLDRKKIEHKPVFDFLSRVSGLPSPHTIQVVVCFDSPYFGEWLDFQEESKISVPRIPLHLFDIEKGMGVLRKLLALSHIHVQDKIAHAYLSDMAEEDQTVSPFAIALGVLAFATWPKQASLRDYAKAGGVKAVLSAHVQKQFGPYFVLPNERRRLLAGLVATVVDVPKSDMKPAGATAAEIAEASGLPIERIETYLEGLVAGRILEEHAVGRSYTVSHRKLNPILIQLQMEAPQPSDSATSKYQNWKQHPEEKTYLRGKELEWAEKNWVVHAGDPDKLGRWIYVKKSRSASRRRLILRWAGAIVIVGVIAGAILTGISHRRTQKTKDDAERAKAALKQANLPPDLYDRQSQFESLSIEWSTLRNLNWIHSSNLVKLSVTGNGLESLAGLSSAGRLRSLTLAVSGAADLKSILDLSHLRELTLLNAGHLSEPFKLDTSTLSELHYLNLDLQGGKLTSLPALAPNLDRLVLDLRYSDISDISAITTLSSVTDLKILLNRTAIKSLKSVAALPSLTKLHLSLDDTQLGLLQSLRDCPNSLKLTLDLEPSLIPLPNLAELKPIRELTLNIVSANAGQIESVFQAQQLQHLGLSIPNWGARNLPSLAALSNLRSLELKLKSSSVNELPDLTTLHALNHLTLDLNSTNVSSLPDFVALKSHLKELDLSLQNKRKATLRGLGQLQKLESLALDIQDADVKDLAEISQLHSLKTLTLHLNWEQVHNSGMPNLAALNLQQVELDLDRDWGFEELPELAGLNHVTQLKLVLSGTHIESLHQPKSIEKLTLVLGKGSKMNVGQVAPIDGLQDITLNFCDSAMNTLPDLRKLVATGTIAVDISGSEVRSLSRLSLLPRVDELTIDTGFDSLDGIPSSVKALSFRHGCASKDQQVLNQ